MEVRTKLKKALIDIGLNDNESALYLALLSLGPASASAAARAAALKRTTAYAVIDSLRERGLLNVELRGLRKLFVAQSAEKLESILDAKRRMVQNLLPEFEAFSNLKGGEALVRYYEGLAAVKSVYEDVLERLKEDDYYWALSDQQRWLALDEEYFSQLKRRRSLKNIRSRLLLQDSPSARENLETQKGLHEEVRILPPKTELGTNLVITPFLVAIHQLSTPVTAIVIQNRAVIQMHREMFRIIWDFLAISPANKKPALSKLKK